ncbi:hypothetical protein GZH47_31435 (plasmid) [Paenibacillus rhizovicinus]|uniref:YtkA-like domain-containing protein n=1 Tax=Paenibacillus rhizovicinus TaxID=2704463 RepID=A0A6C0PAF5_9BACL|nr:hypothetical protein [Paenibacillus rhizovicinus]QHW35416.1 hypothetical protein GZH47_31435 [Paenibacillus rhizovicinus]
MLLATGTLSTEKNEKGVMVLKYAASILVACLMICMLITGCSSTKETAGQDPAAIKVTLSTNPSPAVIGEKIQLSAKITGLNDTDGAQVQFDLRTSDLKALPALVNATLGDNGEYTADHVFKEAGTYKVYVHLYQDDLHMTKKSELVVQK